jgi:PIN domain nuclease of toxin-antitoxin system
LGARVGEAVAAPENQVFLSSASVWEIAIKTAAGRVVFPIERFDEIVRTLGFDTLPILPVHAVAAGRLPLHHADPFDRMLIAQATVENLMLVTNDRWIARYDVRIFGG